MRPSLLRSLILTVALASLPVSAMAVPLLDPTLDLPDVVSGTLDVVYDASGPGTLTISGFALEVDDDGVAPNLQLDVLAVGSFSLTASVNTSGIFSSGSFSILGTVASEGWNSGTLLTGDLNAFGWNAGATLMDFTFDATGGDLEPLYGGSEGGIIVATGILPGWAGFGSSFNNNFGSPGFGTGTGDTAPLPEPTTGLLFAAALAVATRFGRRSR